jgi:hypothetical protein
MESGYRTETDAGGLESDGEIPSTACEKPGFPLINKPVDDVPPGSDRTPVAELCSKPEELNDQLTGRTTRSAEDEKCGHLW